MPYVIASKRTTLTAVGSVWLGLCSVLAVPPAASEGQPFFAIGQNLAFIGNQQYADLSKAEEIFGELSRNGANFLRVWTCCEDWATAIEARKSAWGRSWHWKPPLYQGFPEPRCSGGGTSSTGWRPTTSIGRWPLF